jgi:uncharacterized protein (DUF488 family)
MTQGLTIYTIGHSDHSVAAFVDLLRQHGITTVVDVRSQPYSRWAHQFNRETLARDLKGLGFTYAFMGSALGGRPSNLDVPQGERPNYQLMEQAAIYQSGIDQLLDLGRAERVAVMCSEGDYRQCHRNLLIAQTLLARGVRVLHIQPDGRTVEGELIPRQLSLL